MALRAIHKFDMCCFCNSNKDLHKHHVKPKRFNGEDTYENVALLCNECHIWFHTNYDYYLDQYNSDTNQKEFVKIFMDAKKKFEQNYRHFIKQPPLRIGDMYVY